MAGLAYSILWRPLRAETEPQCTSYGLCGRRRCDPDPSGPLPLCGGSSSVFAPWPRASCRPRSLGTVALASVGPGGLAHLLIEYDLPHQSFVEEVEDKVPCLKTIVMALEDD
jgi:hypothetical protein